MTTRSLSSLVIAAASGDTDTGVTLYWDTTDPHSPGPAYRTPDESGPLDCLGWCKDGYHVPAPEGIHLEDYFRGPDGAYTGPDADGVYPALVPA